MITTKAPAIPDDIEVLPADLTDRLRRLRARRLAEDERLVCWERARLLHASRQRYATLPPTRRQAAIIGDLCESITPIIEPEDILLGRMPEIIPNDEQEQFITDHPELFREPGVSGWLDSLSIFVPDWDWLLSAGLGGLAAEWEQASAVSTEASEFTRAAAASLRVVSRLLRRYAEAARQQAGGETSPPRRSELLAAATRCETVAEHPPRTFLEALQLLQVVHMVLSCLIGGRDVTPGRLDQYLLPFYQADLQQGRLTRGQAVELLAMFFLRLSQTAGNATDFDDNLRRSPCQYSHLYVTIGGTDRQGSPAVNPLSCAILEAVDLLAYKEPTVVVRWTAGQGEAFAAAVAGLIGRRRPVTIYNDEVVVSGLLHQGVAREQVRDYAHSACHNVIAVGQEAGSGPGGFHSLPWLILLAMNAGQDLPSGAQRGAATPAPEQIETFDDFLAALREQVKYLLGGVRQSFERIWQDRLANSCPLLQSALYRYSLAAGQPCWQAAPVSHYNCHLMGLATGVNALLALRQLVFEEGRLTLREFAQVLADNWAGHEQLRQEIRNRLPRYGQDEPPVRALVAEIGRMWVTEVETAARGMQRLAMWPGFYSHMVHVSTAARIGATPDGRRAGEPLSENLSPSPGTYSCTPTSILNTLAELPFDHTPSGAMTLTLPPGEFTDAGSRQQVVSLIESYFGLGGLQIQVNIVDAATLRAAMAQPEEYSDLTVRVAGFSALFVRLSREVQEDVLRRCPA